MICRFCEYPVLQEVEVVRTDATRILQIACTHCEGVVERVEYVLRVPKYQGLELEKRKNRNT
ncbi:hypothetical protein [Candidatus Korobacter versatilis]|uniref:hypothetical protein n=1 Tax=Candidatus Korobacter versatilis TaxID=658062 RepID=UPI000324EB3A|nr:hypothetical protein [Candidatus Koribacter versatilis]